MSKIAQKEYFDTLKVPGVSGTCDRIAQALKEEAKNIDLPGVPRTDIQVSNEIEHSYYNPSTNTIILAYDESKSGIDYARELHHHAAIAQSLGSLGVNPDERKMSYIAELNQGNPDSIAHKMTGLVSGNYLTTGGTIAEARFMMDEVKERLNGEVPFTSPEEINQYQAAMKELSGRLQTQGNPAVTIAAFTQTMSNLTFGTSPHQRVGLYHHAALKDKVEKPGTFMRTTGRKLMMERAAESREVAEEIKAMRKELNKAVPQNAIAAPVNDNPAQSMPASDTSTLTAEELIAKLKASNITVQELGDEVPIAGTRVAGIDNLDAFLKSTSPTDRIAYIAFDGEQPVFYIADAKTPTMPIPLAEQEAQTPEQTTDTPSQDVREPDSSENDHAETDPSDGAFDTFDDLEDR